ncbi:MAG: SDR family NAD(P)-dependent oxidoreductase [Nitratireductor sp.]|nr:SDR family NAD(P)-dependent oxidoreductase [Nitratireductor sp.]
MAVKRALITGASMGLGAAFAAILAGDGWELVTVDRQPHDNDDAHSSAAARFQCELSDPAEVTRLLEGLEQGEGFDLVILNAGANATGRFEAIDPDVIPRLVHLNAFAPMALAAGFANAGKLKAGSHLLFISSLSHFTGYPGASAYAGTKDAIAIYAKSIRKPFAAKGISVSCAFPGPLRTTHAERHAPTGAQAEKRMLPEEAAEKIVAATLAGKKTIIPGLGPKLFSIAGRAFPRITSRVMRHLIYDRLDREVW